MLFRSRKKDIRYKMTPESVDELAALQRQILDTVHTYVKPNEMCIRDSYCGYRQPVPKVCPSCGSKYISGFKAGTQKIEAMVAKRFPQARILRCV